MKKTYTFTGNQRSGDTPGLYPNYPDVVKLSYQLDSDKSETNGIVLKTANNQVLSYKKVSDWSPESSVYQQLEKEPRNFFLGSVCQEEIEITNNSSVTPQTAQFLPQNLHFFDITQADGSVVCDAFANYNFYVDSLESLDSSTPFQTQQVVRPSDFYAYNSVKLKYKDTDTVANNEYSFKTFKEYTKLFTSSDPIEVSFLDKKKIAGMYKPFLSQKNYNKTDGEYASAYAVAAAFGLASSAAADPFAIGDTAPSSTPPFPVPFPVPSQQAQQNNAVGNFKINNVSFLSLDKELIDFTNERQSVTPFNAEIVSNFNITPEVQNNEFKELLKDLNIYETFIYNVLDRATKPFFSLSDDGEKFPVNTSPFLFSSTDATFTSLGRGLYNIRRAPCVGETLKYALKQAQFIPPKALPNSQDSQIKDLVMYGQNDFSNALASINPTYDKTSSVVAAQSDINRTDFIYRMFEENNSLNGFDSYIFQAKMKEFVDRNFLTIGQRILDEKGKLRPSPLKNYVEVLAYSVERHRVVTSPEGTTIPEFEKEYIIPASSNKEDIIKVIDAGINYNTEYVYRFFCHVISVGTGVKPLQNQTKANLDIITSNFLSYPDLRIMKVPLKEITGVIAFDKPPVYPTVTVLPSRFDAEKVKIVFNDNVSGIKTKPIAIFNEDILTLQKVVRANKKDYEGAFADGKVSFDDIVNFVTSGQSFFTDEAAVISFLNSLLNEFDFSSRSPIVSYQALRLEVAPLNYADFHSALVTTINKNENTGFIDSITPNKTYYYCFRAINAHGLVSNPSPIIELSVTQEGEIHTAELKEYSFPSEVAPAPQPTTAKSNGIVSVGFSEQAIQPNLQPAKTALDQAQKLNFQQIKIGDKNIDPFDPDMFYKVRIKSKSTGRAIDLNFFPKLVTIDKTGQSSAQNLKNLKSKGFFGSDLVELSNLLDVDIKVASKLLTNEEEFRVNTELIEAIVDKIQNNKLDKQTLESLLANFSKLKSN